MRANGVGPGSAGIAGGHWNHPAPGLTASGRQVSAYEGPALGISEDRYSVRDGPVGVAGCGEAIGTWMAASISQAGQHGHLVHDVDVPGGTRRTGSPQAAKSNHPLPGTNTEPCPTVRRCCRAWKTPGRDTGTEPGDLLGSAPHPERSRGIDRMAPLTGCMSPVADACARSRWDRYLFPERVVDSHRLPLENRTSRDPAPRRVRDRMADSLRGVVPRCQA